MFSLAYKQNVYHKDNDYITNTIKGNFWEPEVVDIICKHLVDGTDFVDIGAHIGLISLGVHVKKPGVTIHCFECNNTNFGYLYKNMKQHPTINLYNFALGDTNKLCNMIVNEYNSGCTHINSVVHEDGSKQSFNYSYLEGLHKDIYSKNNIWFSVVPLDSVQFTNKVSVVKIDVEGFEPFVILGAKKFLELHKPVIIIEVSNDNKEKINVLLQELGYCQVLHISYENYMYQLKN
jgi:FkbM family methyltransferase